MKGIRGGRWVALAALWLAVSCASDGREVVVPGEPKVRSQNFAAEYLQIAGEYEKLKDYSKAIEYYQLALDKAPEAANAIHYKMARCYALGKDWQHARPAYEALLAEDEQNTSLRVSLAYITAMGGDMAAARNQYRVLVEENPTDANILKSYIAVLMADGKYELAERQFYILKKLYPDDETLATTEAKLADGLGL